MNNERTKKDVYFASGRELQTHYNDFFKEKYAEVNCVLLGRPISDGTIWACSHMDPCACIHSCYKTPYMLFTSKKIRAQD